MESVLLHGYGEQVNNIDISIIIPTYKRTEYLYSALDSIFCQDSEGLTYEVIVVNNNPEDKMAEVIEKYACLPVSFYSNIENYGQVGNNNQGISKSRGRYVAFLHDDDMLMPYYFREIRKYIGDDRISCLITSQYDMYTTYKVDYKRGFVRAIFCFRNLYRKDLKEIRYADCLFAFRDIYNPPTCGTLFLKKDLLAFGGFQDRKGAAWDYYNFREFNKTYRVFLLHKHLGIRRMFTGMSNNPRIEEEFIADEKDLVSENQDNWFIRIFGEAYLTKKGMKYHLARVLRAVYLYTNNLDGTKNISKKDFENYKD